MAKFYITAAIPYVNAKPHVGHALEFVQGDVIARYHRLLGDKVIYLTGSDENALKNVQAAEKAGKDIRAFCAEHAQEFQDVAKALDVQFDVFQKSSSENHHLSSKELWKRCAENGDIYQKTYEGLYCVGCEAFYTRDELDENGECFEHPGKKLEVVGEKNYFFRLSKYAQEILRRIESDEIRILPESRKHEVIEFLKGDVQDISISRSKERARNWGVEVPNDPSQIMYVWFDALNVYQSGIGFGSDQKTYETWWPADVHLIGKGIIRFHAVYWPAMLLSAKLQLPKQIFAHGYITVNGQKMSKTLGNVIDPHDLIRKFGVETVRYYFLREIPTQDDGDLGITRLQDTYTSELANELGNLVSRFSKLCEGYTLAPRTTPKTFSKNVATHIESFAFKDAMDDIWQRISELNKHINHVKLWELQGEDRLQHLNKGAHALLQIGYDLQPFLPKTAKAILKTFSATNVTQAKPLFPKLPAEIPSL